MEVVAKRIGPGPEQVLCKVCQEMDIIDQKIAVIQAENREKARVIAEKLVEEPKYQKMVERFQPGELAKLKIIWAKPDKEGSKRHCTKPTEENATKKAKKRVISIIVDAEVKKMDITPILDLHKQRSRLGVEHPKCAACRILFGDYHCSYPEKTEVGVLCGVCARDLRKYGVEVYRQRLKKGGVG